MTRKRRRTNALAYGLMGAATGFLSSLLEGFKTERALAAKKMEADELRKLALEDRTELRDYQTKVRGEDKDFSISNREDEQAARKAERDADAASRKSERRDEAGLRVSEGAKDRAFRREENTTNREAQRAADEIRYAADRNARQVKEDSGQIIQMANGARAKLEWGMSPPQGAKVIGTYGSNINTDRASGRPDPLGLNNRSPKDQFFDQYTQANQ